MSLTKNIISVLPIFAFLVPGLFGPIFGIIGYEHAIWSLVAFAISDRVVDEWLE